MPFNKRSNMETAIDAWGASMPDYIRLLATACDRTSQSVVAKTIGRSGGFVSRVINNCYPGDLAEAETLVRAAFGTDQVNCPLYGEIPLASCVQNRRRKAPCRNAMQLQFAATCPGCPCNTDGGQA